MISDGINLQPFASDKLSEAKSKEDMGGEQIVPKPTTILLDVDGTLANLGTGNYNQNLARLLNFFGFNQVSFLTRMGINQVPAPTGILRNELIDQLAKWNIQVEQVYTPLDLMVTSEHDKVYLGKAYKEHIYPIEQAATALKNTEWFGAKDLISDDVLEQKAMREAEISARFRTFRNAYNARQDKGSLIGLPGISAENEQIMQTFLKAHQEGFQWFSDNSNQVEYSKAEVRLKLELDDVIFIDDSIREREPYQKMHPNDLVLAPPHNNGFSNQGRQEPIYLSCASFIQSIIHRIGMFPAMSEKYIEELVYFAEQDETASYTTQALDLYKIAYVMAKQDGIENITKLAEERIIKISSDNPQLSHTLRLDDYKLPEKFSKDLDGINFTYNEHNKNIIFDDKKPYDKDPSFSESYEQDKSLSTKKGSSDPVRQDLIERLDKYRADIDKNKLANDNTDFSAGFTFFKKSRATNRNANYLLAQHLSKRLSTQMKVLLLSLQICSISVVK